MFIEPPGRGGGHATALERRQLLPDFAGPRPVAHGMYLLSPGVRSFLFAGFDAESARMRHNRKIVNAAVSKNQLTSVGLYPIASLRFSDDVLAALANGRGRN